MASGTFGGAQTTPPLAQRSAILNVLHFSLDHPEREKGRKKSFTMAPKGKGAADKGGAAKGTGKGKSDEKAEKGGKVKASQFVNVRHILVYLQES